MISDGFSLVTLLKCQENRDYLHLPDAFSDIHTVPAEVINQARYTRGN